MWCEHVCHQHATTVSGLRNVMFCGQTLHPTTNFILSWQDLILSLSLSDIILLYLGLCLLFLCALSLSLPPESTLCEEADRLCFVHITHPDYMGHFPQPTDFYLCC